MWRWLLVLGLLVVGCGMGPTTYPGDKTEERTCRWCGGTGLAGPMDEGPHNTGGKCPGCRGAKKLTVVIPGPNHPAMVRGTVRDATKMGEDSPLLSFEESHTPGPVRGAVGGAKVVFEGVDRVEYTVPSSGKVKTLLKPGHYKVTISAPGFQEAQEEVEVAQRREPIWDEKAHLKTEEQEADTTYVDFVLHP